MPRSAPQQKKDVEELAADIRDVFVVNAQKHRPYIELFRYTPENIAQQKLGSFLGFFHIRDRSHESGYVVNFLTSTAKKEYFANPKRTAAESFEASLHRVNIALAELAKQGNVGWLGTIDAVLCAVENDTVHIGVTGNGTALLIRNGTMTNIGEDLASHEAETNPLKTFSDIASGHVQRDDLLILTTPELFSLFSAQDLLKNTQRFSPHDFAQLIATALTNEMEMAGTFVIHITKQEVRRAMPSATTPRAPINAFSEKAFRPTTHPTAETSSEQHVPRDQEYTDHRTGHIYVQDTENHLTDRDLHPVLFTFTEKMSDFRSVLLRHGKNILRGAARHTGNLARVLFRKSSSFVALLRTRMHRTTRRDVPTFVAERGAERVTRPSRRAWHAWRDTGVTKMRLFISRFRAQQPSSHKVLPYAPQTFTPRHDALWKRIPLPNVRALVHAFLALDYAKKLYALAAVIAIIILPILVNRFLFSNETSHVPPVVESPSPEMSVPLAQDKNVMRLDQPRIFSLPESTRATFSLQQAMIVVTETKVFVSTDGTSYSDYVLPEGSGRIVRSAAMEDLQLVFLLTDSNTLFSFSPVSKKFSANAITLGQNSGAVKGLGTYLTYLYVLDSDARQILRYPRAEGGFGNGTAWLKESSDLSNITGMAIDENIYLVRNDGQIEKWFRGQKQEFRLEESATPLRPLAIFTTSTTSHLYILDATNKRIVQYGKDGTLVRQYTHDLLADAHAFSIDEETRVASIATPSTILSFSLPQ